MRLDQLTRMSKVNYPEYNHLDLSKETIARREKGLSNIDEHSPIVSASNAIPKVSRNTIQRDLLALVESGLIKEVSRIGRGRGITYARVKIEN